MSEDSETLIQLRKLGRVFLTDRLETHALGGIDLDIQRGEYVAVEGPSGCGKSTLMAVLGLLDQASSGEYVLAGVPTTEIDAEEQARLRNQEIGFVFQGFNLIVEMSVRENVELPLIYRNGLSATARKNAVDSALEQVGLSSRADHQPHQLSGGQQQRVAIARALVGEPSLLLADEPTGNLDSKSAQQVMALLGELNAAGSTLIMVTHNPDFAQQAQRQLSMKDGIIVDHERFSSAT